MGKFSSEEIESQYNLIKMLLAEPEKYRNAINAIKKDIEYMPIELKKKLEEENIIYLELKSYTLYSFLNLVVGPLSVYVCALNRTFLLVDW